MRSAPTISRVPGILVAPFVAVAVVAFSSVAAAQPPQGADGVAAPAAVPVKAEAKTKATVKKVDGHDVYDFPDDPLDGDSLGASIIRIPVLRHASRASLVRPRLSFVPEMVKSTDGL